MQDKTSANTAITTNIKPPPTQHRIARTKSHIKQTYFDNINSLESNIKSHIAKKTSKETAVINSVLVHQLQVIMLSSYTVMLTYFTTNSTTSVKNIKQI